MCINNCDENLSKNAIFLMKIKCLVIISTIFVDVLLPSLCLSSYLQLEKDKDGWTIFAPSSDTNIVYVDGLSGNDTTCRGYLASDPEIGNSFFDPIGNIKTCATPKKAISLIGKGKPDWILFKRGSVFDVGISNDRSGRGISEPLVLSSYGDNGDLPVFHGGYANNGNVNTHYVVISGLSFYNDKKDPGSKNYSLNDNGSSTGAFFFSHESYTIKGILIEGCKFRYFKDNITFSPKATSGNEGIVIRRNGIYDSYSRSEGHSQGLFASNINGMLVEENIFDHNGWLVQNDGDGITEPGEATMFNHNLYISGSKNLTIRDNIFSRASSNNTKLRFYKQGEGSGVVVRNNLYIGGEVAISGGAPDEHESYSLVYPLIENNIFLYPGYPNPTNRRIGWFFYNFNWDGGIIKNNIMAHQYDNSIGGHFFHMQYSGRNITISNNIVSDAKNIVPILLGPLDSGYENPVREKIIFNDNIFQVDGVNSYIVQADYSIPLTPYIFFKNKYSSLGNTNSWFRALNSTFTNDQWREKTGDTSIFDKVSFPDASRSIETYMSSVLSISDNQKSIELFADILRRQDRFNWDNRISAESINAWIRKGFLRAPSSFRLYQ